jgi:hypothetical protein
MNENESSAISELSTSVGGVCNGLGKYSEVSVSADDNDSGLEVIGTNDDLLKTFWKLVINFAFGFKPGNRLCLFGVDGGVTNI